MNPVNSRVTLENWAFREAAISVGCFFGKRIAEAFFPA
jgi:hypothetical protein